MTNEDGHVIYIINRLTQGFSNILTYFNKNIYEISWFNELYIFEKEDLYIIGTVIL